MGTIYTEKYEKGILGRDKEHCQGIAVCEGKWYTQRKTRLYTLALAGRYGQIILENGKEVIISYFNKLFHMK